MWRYVAGGMAAVLVAAAGWTLTRGDAAGEPVLPAAPPAEASRAAEAPLPASVPEATPRTREEKRFGRYDKDRDGAITRDEYLATRRKAYARLDRNGDGALQFEEWAARTTAKFATADRDRSGAMTATEFATTAVKRSARPRADCPPAKPADDD